MGCAFKQRLQPLLQSRSKLTMKFLLIVALLCCSAWAQTETPGASCTDKRDDCSAALCHGTGFLVCKKTCEDCDGAKYKAFEAAYNGADCADAYPPNLCEVWSKVKDEKYGCNGERSALKKGCRKTCGHCEVWSKVKDEKYGCNGERS